MESLKKLLVITGPTATGKTKVAINVASQVGGEIISADSMLVYKGMNIGTDKPSREDLIKVKHHMIDIVEPNQEFNVALYKEMVEKLIVDISNKGKLPVMVGGTGLYIKAVVDNYNFKNAGNDPDLRLSLLKEARLKGTDHLHKKLSVIDPKTAARLHPNDTKRIIRALEIYHETGKALSDMNDREENKKTYNFKIFALYMNRKKLYEKINIRVDEMLKSGLVEEVQKLLSKGYNTELVSMKGLGYKEIASYLEGNINLEQAVYLLKRNTRRFAKRQLTWFRRDHRIRWIDVEKHPDEFSIAAEIIANLEGLLPVK